MVQNLLHKTNNTVVLLLLLLVLVDDVVIAVDTVEGVDRNPTRLGVQPVMGVRRELKIVV
jgi:hypothetical protein